MMLTVPGKQRIELGQLAEQLAAEYLEQRGLKQLARNYRCRSGEIDLIMQEDDYLVFVEVRYRKHSGYGGAAASVDQRKQRKLLHTAQHYLQQHRALNRPCRFDVVAVTPSGDGNLQCDWIKNAFELE